MYCKFLEKEEGSKINHASGSLVVHMNTLWEIGGCREHVKAALNQHFMLSTTLRRVKSERKARCEVT